MAGLKQELVEELDHLQRLARRNYKGLYVLSILAIGASFFAGLSVALDWFEKEWLAVLSAIPAAALVASDRLNLEAKAKWYWAKFYSYRSILNEMDYEGLSEADGSKRRRTIDQEHEPRWPGLGAPPK